MNLTTRRLLLLIALLVSIFILVNWLLLDGIAKEEQEHEATGRYERTKKTALSSCPLPDDLAVSAMARMRTDQCKDKLREVACAIEEGRLYETFPPSACPLYNHSKKDEYLGCYDDSVKHLSRTNHTFTWKDDNSREKCGLMCGRAGFVYYGVQNGVECFCSNSIAGGTNVAEERCQTHSCPDGKEKCGGLNSIAVYASGLTKPLDWPRPSYVDPELSKDYDIRILFILQLNGRNVRQVRQMLRSIYSHKHHYCIHVDSRQKYMLNGARILSSEFPNIRVASILRPTIWGGASLLPMITDSIESSLDLQWDHLINMSESDQLVLSLKELEAQLHSNRGNSFLALHGHSTVNFLNSQGFGYVWLECENRMWKIATRQSFPPNLGLTGGSDWVVLHRDFAEFSVSREELPTKLRRLFMSTILPVESFFHSLAVNSQFCTSIIGGNLRKTSWSRSRPEDPASKAIRCERRKKVVDMCGKSPIAFTGETAESFNLKNAKRFGYYFARKFDSVVNNEAILKAQLQSSRFSSLALNLSHPRANSSFVNVFNAEVDESSNAHSSFLRGILPSSGKGKVKDLFMNKQSDGAEKELIVVFEDESTGHCERLFHFSNQVDIEDGLVVEGFSLTSLEIGTDFDHKEEMLRGYSKFIPVDGEATLLLQWSNKGSSEKILSSPECIVEWRDGSGRIVANQTSQPYDSPRGRQFIDLHLKTLPNVQPGIWTATVTDTTSRRLGSISFGVFSAEDSVTRSTVEGMYRLVDECRGVECKSKIWASSYPDPKCEIA